MNVTRVGIELSPVACRIVELEARRGPLQSTVATRVRSYASLPAGSEDAARAIAALKNRPVAVVVWGLRADYRQVVVARRSYEVMRTEALEAARQAGVDTTGTLADIAPPPRDANPRTPIGLAVVDSDELTSAIQPLLDAGLRIHALETPVLALASLARTRRSLAIPDAAEVYVALEETRTAVALVRNGALFAGCELPWGYLDGQDVTARTDMASQLSSALIEFFEAAGVPRSSVTQISICGGMPELRSMTVPLVEQLDLEVEPLDSMFGIDPARLPEPAAEFRERSAELRVAWAAAADWDPPINFMRDRHRQMRRVMARGGAILAGTAAGLAIGWIIQQVGWSRSSGGETRTALVARATTSVRPAASSVAATTSARPVQASTAPATTTAPLTSAPTTSAPTTSSLTTTSLRPVTSSVSTTSARPTTSALPTTSVRPTTSARPTTLVQPPPIVPGSASAPPPTSVLPTTTVPRVASVPSTSSERPLPPAPVRPTTSIRATPPPPARTAPPAGQPGTATTPARPNRAAPTPPAPLPIPFDAVLATILYAPDRKLAIIDDRIVGIGDQVRGARIVDITPTTVLLRDAQGRLRSLAVGASGR